MPGPAGAGVWRWRCTGTEIGPGSPGRDPGSEAGPTDTVPVALTHCCCSGSRAAGTSILDQVYGLCMGFPGSLSVLFFLYYLMGA